jgi:hypothetical protein
LAQQQHFPNFGHLILQCKGNHSLENARRNHVQFIPSWKIRAVHLVDYLTKEKGYLAFIDYWNEKCRQKEQ